MTDVAPETHSPRLHRRSRRHPRDRVVPPWLSVAAAAGVAVAIGLLAGKDPMLAVAAVAGLVLVAITLMNLTAGLCVFIVAAFLETLPRVGGLASVTKLMGALLIAGWLAAAATHQLGERRRRDLLIRHQFLVWTLVLFVSWAMFSMIWAEDPTVARSTAIRFALLLMLFPVVYAAVFKVGHVQAVFAIFICGALLSAAFGFVTGTATQEDGRLAGAGQNANGLGTTLMLATVFAVTLACLRSWPLIARLIAAAGGLLCVVALVATASRGSLLGLAVAMLVTPLLIGRGRRLQAAAVVAAVALVAVLWINIFAADSLAVQRLTQASHSGSGRVDIWTVGLRMVEANPVLGVGAGNFKNTSVHYLLEPGAIIRDEFIVDEPKVPHNIYLNVLVEIGTIGLVLFVAIVGYCLAACWRAARVAADRRDIDVETLARGLLIALVGVFCGLFFSSQLYNKQIWLLLALTPALLAIAEGRGGRRSVDSTPSSKDRQG